MASGSTGRKGSYPKGRAKRDEILRSALDLIANDGYRRSTLQEIANRVGLTKAGVLHHFGSKEQLFAEVLRLRDRLPAGDRSPDGDHRAGPAGEGMIDAFVAAIGHNAEVPGLVQLYTSLSAEAVDPDHDAHDFFARRFRNLRPLLAAAVEQAKVEGRIRPEVDGHRLATILIALADGLQTQWLIEGDIDMADHVAYLLELVSPPADGGLPSARIR